MLSFSTLTIGLSLIAATQAGQDDVPLRFDTADHGDPGDKAPILKPWKTVDLDPEYGGYWLVTGDVDGDGEVELVSCRNVDKDDVHYTSTAVAQRLDGSVLWRWGDPSVGRRNLHHDVACQIYDWDGDGKNEVILLTKGFLVELDGATGEERRRFPIPPEATDCVAFVNLSGGERATDVLVKTRYSQIWAYNYDGELLWTVEKPGGYNTAHQATPIDIDGDGRDEIMAGYALLNPDGSVRWQIESNNVDLGRRGHLDCCRVLRRGEKPEDWRLVLTCCGDDNIAAVDGNGKTIWERSGHHFESIQVGKIFPDVAGPQILVDIDHRPMGEGPLWVLDEHGTLLGQIMTDYCRIHALIDWDGDGYDEMAVAHSRALFNREGKRILTFDMDSPGNKVMLGDMTGNGRHDLTLTEGTKVSIFKNENGKQPEEPRPLGCGVNFTYY